LTTLNDPGVLGPDTNVAYYNVSLQLPPGGTVTLHGQFPHSRFFSLTSYKKVGTETGIAAPALTADEIVPDPCSTNPLADRANSKAKQRSYTVTVSGQLTPAEPAPNTLYVGQEGKTGETQQVEMILRIYRPDRNLDANAGVPLPTPTFNPSEESPIGGEEE